MPQRDDKVGIYFGRIDEALWNSLGERPATTIENAIAALAAAKDAGQAIRYPAVTKRGVRKKVWLTPETTKVLRAIQEEAGLMATPVILAALAVYRSSPSGAASRRTGSPPGTPTTSGTP
jgi:hypothetical protein